MAAPQPQKKAESEASVHKTQLGYKDAGAQVPVLLRKSAPVVEVRAPIVSKFEGGGGDDRWMVTPGVPELLERVSNGEVMVDDLEVSNRFGTIKFIDPVNVNGLDMDATFLIEKRRASIRSETEQFDNARAYVTLRDIVPSKPASPTDAQFSKFKERLRSANAASGADFIAYDREEGTWTFLVRGWAGVQACQ